MYCQQCRTQIADGAAYCAACGAAVGSSPGPSSVILRQRRDLTLKDGTQIWLRKNTGIVASVKDWAETHVTSSGGGGYLHEGTGRISAPTVTSSTVHRQVFFVQYEDGSQKEFDSTLISVGVGHRVTEVWGAKLGAEYGLRLSPRLTQTVKTLPAVR